MTIAVFYDKALEKVFDGQISFTSDTIRCALVDSAYTPNRATDEFWSDAAGDEVAGTGYTGDGETVTGIALSLSGHTLVIDCDDVSWTGATISGIRYAVFYKDTGTLSTSPLIGYMDFESDQSVTSNTFTVVIPVTGLIRATAA